MKNIQNDIVIYPTDTVWGIGGSIFSEAAYNEIAKIKQTKFDKPLSIMFYSFSHFTENFNLPSFMTEEWLRAYFKLESTLGLPVDLLKTQLPDWLISKSNFLSIRFLETDISLKIGEHLKTPFFTTSLNITGQPPIVNATLALEFKNAHASKALFFESKNINLSGESSTIIFFEKTHFKLIRKARMIDEIKELLKKTHLDLID